MKAAWEFRLITGVFLLYFWRKTVKSIWFLSHFLWRHPNVLIKELSPIIPSTNAVNLFLRCILIQVYFILAYPWRCHVCACVYARNANMTHIFCLLPHSSNRSYKFIESLLNYASVNALPSKPITRINFSTKNFVFGPHSVYLLWA